METSKQRPRDYYLEIFLIAFAALLLEISYTRVFSFKLFYYFAYFVIGFSMLGLGSGGVCVALSARLRRAPLGRLLSAGALAGSVCILLSYVLIANIQLSLWSLFSSLSGLGGLVLVSFSLYVSFLAIGIMIAALLTRKTEVVARLYFADLVGAGLACAVVIPLMSLLTPPGCVFLSASLLAGAGMKAGLRESRVLSVACVVVALGALGGALFPGMIPDPIPDANKNFNPRMLSAEEHLFSEWGSLFRLDVVRNFGNDDSSRLMLHDGTLVSALYRFDGDASTLSRFDSDPRMFPFLVAPPGPNVLIIGAAGGHEILASLYFKASHITAVEINPITVSLITGRFADYVGNLADLPNVDYVCGEGRAFLTSQEATYDLIYFVAPDSFASMNAATSSAFVLSESYLYTREMIETCLDHLNPEGIICMQYGEIVYDAKPNRTARYVATAREAFAHSGVADFDRHVAVLSAPGYYGEESTILIRKTPFTGNQADTLASHAAQVPGGLCRHPIDQGPGPTIVNRVLAAADDDLDSVYGSYPYNIRPVADNAPFFWHFVRFRDVMRPRSDAARASLHYDDCVGERILLLLLLISACFAAAGLLLPFVFIRNTWRSLPKKGHSFVYFGALGLGFMFFEIALIQKFTLFLGYPTRSLSVTLMSMLFFAGLGSLASSWYTKRPQRALLALLASVILLAILYQTGLDPLMRALVGQPLALRIGLTVALIAPLALCLGGFMPLGLTAVSRLTEHNQEYVAWAWAVNGFFSVIGSALTTILAMSFGFRVVFLLALIVYSVGVLSMISIPGAARARVSSES